VNINFESQDNNSQLSHIDTDLYRNHQSHFRAKHDFGQEVRFDNRLAARAAFPD
jgi:hypothetical protein